MKSYTKQELAEVLERHATWLRDDAEGLRVNLGYADLRSASLSPANMTGVRNLVYASCGWSDHGECGRILEKGDESLRASRTPAAYFVEARLEEMKPHGGLQMTTGHPTLKPIMTTKEVAEALGITVSEVRRLYDKGLVKRLRGYRKPMKFSSVEITRWLKGEVRT